MKKSIESVLNDSKYLVDAVRKALNALDALMNKVESERSSHFTLDE